MFRLMQHRICGLLIVGMALLSAHALRGAETNHNFAKWEKEIAAFERMDRTNPPPKDAILFTGASNIRRWKTLVQDFPGYPVLNRGFGGSEIIDATHFADRIVFPYAPRLIFLRAGGNEMWRGKSPEETFADFRAFVAKVHAKLPQTDIVYIGGGPSPARLTQNDKVQVLNTMIQDFLRGKPYLKYLDTYSMVLGTNGQPRPELFAADGLHFNAAGYSLLAEKVRAFLPLP
jgi:lysophospholipase L1-like esterase